MHKIYLADNGFIQVLVTRITKDKGFLLENLIFNSLHCQEIFYLFDKKECDFITVDNKKIKQVIQVTWELNTTNTEREIDGLIEAMKKLHQNKGMILTYDQEDTLHNQDKTIVIKPAWKWLCE